MSQSIYTGPGKVYVNAIALQPNGESGTVDASIEETTSDASTAMFGFQGEVLIDQVVKLKVTPFDNWGNIGTLYPPYLGVTSAAGTGALAIGTRAHDALAGSANGNAATKVWNPAGQLLNVVRTAITQPPPMKFGPGQALFGQCEITGLRAYASGAFLNPGDAGFLIAGNALTETGATDPGGAFTMADFVRGRWTGAFGAIAGFGGDGGAALEVDGTWDLVPTVKWNVAKVSGLSTHYWLASVRYMFKGKLVGPSRTQVAARILAHTLGQRLGAADLILTGPSAKTVTLKNCEVKGMGIPYGGTGIAAGEVAFVYDQQYTTGAPQPPLIFSA